MKNNPESPVSENDHQASMRQTFARNLRVCRHMRGISQEELANMAQMSRSYVSGVEKGRRNVSINNMASSAVALNMPLKNLVDPDFLSVDGKLLIEKDSLSTY